MCIRDSVEEVFPDRSSTDASGRTQWLVADFTLAEIKQLDAGSWFDPKFAGERVLTWDEAVDLVWDCLLYTSDAADERSSVDLGGRRIIKKKKHKELRGATSVADTSRRDQVRETRTEDKYRKRNDSERD